MHKLKGDTLIEVALAIGIFSMIAVAVVSVVSASTSSAQSSLETTITREEIDAQAEALRFIQSSYLAGGQSNLAGNIKYSSIWDAITARAIERDKQPGLYEEVLTYNPEACSTLYEANNPSNVFQNIYSQKAFIINTKKLGLSFSGATSSTEIRNLTSQIVVGAAKDNTVFYEASTYPRILYAGSADDALLDQTATEEISRVEGLYVIAVKDPATTTIVSGSTATIKSAYYDFYIRSCWFAPGANTPSTISTVIRLYDPAVIEY